VTRYQIFSITNSTPVLILRSTIVPSLSVVKWVIEISIKALQGGCRWNIAYGNFERYDHFWKIWSISYENELSVIVKTEEGKRKCQNYLNTVFFFNPLLGVWISDEKLFQVFDLLLWNVLLKSQHKRFLSNIKEHKTVFSCILNVFQRC
jgi:hypothetical protein